MDDLMEALNEQLLKHYQNFMELDVINNKKDFQYCRIVLEVRSWPDIS